MGTNAMSKKNKGLKKLKNSQINTPHDKLFKKSMQVPNVAREFLMMHLPCDIKNKIDYNTLEILPDTFIDETLRRSQVDALFKVQYDSQDLLVYILVEQQSKPDHTMPTRRLSYKSDIWASYMETNKNDAQKTLPPIIDLHFYTGSEPYTGPLSLADLAGDNAEMIHQCLIQPMINVWAGDITKEQLKEHPWAATLEFIMKNRKNPDLRGVVREISPNIRLFYMEGQIQYVLSLYTYIENVYSCSTPVEEFARIAGEEISTQAEEDIMTMAEQIRQKGMHDGMHEGMLAVAHKLLKKKYDVTLVAEITNLPIAELEQIKKTLH